MAKKKKRVGPPQPRNTSGLRPWAPGQSGNPKGRTKAKTLSECCRDKLAEIFPDTDHTWAQEVAERMAKLALRRVAAAAEMADRTEGKAPQFMQLSGGATMDAPIFGVKFVSSPAKACLQLPEPDDQLGPGALEIGANQLDEHWALVPEGGD